MLLAAYRASATELERGRGEVPAAEWLLDNYHLVDEHIREIKDDLPPGYYRQLPKLAEGPFAGYPRVFGLAWGFVAHTDSHFDPDSFRRSVDDVVREAQQRQGASNVTVRNISTSMRLISDIDWSEVFESVSLVDERLRAGSPFAAMDFHTRNLYRSAIETLSRGAALSELDIVDHVLAAARTARAATVDAVEVERLGDSGYHLIAAGRPAFERAIGFRLPARLRLARCNSGLGIGGYVGMIGLATLAFLVGAIFALLPASEVATALVNRAVAWSFGAVTLPGLELKAGVPPCWPRRPRPSPN